MRSVQATSKLAMGHGLRLGKRCSFSGVWVESGYLGWRYYGRACTGARETSTNHIEAPLHFPRQELAIKNKWTNGTCSWGELFLVR